MESCKFCTNLFSSVIHLICETLIREEFRSRRSVRRYVSFSFVIAPSVSAFAKLFLGFVPLGFLCFSLHKMLGFLRNEPGENQISAIALASTFAYSLCLFATKILCAQFSLPLIHRWLPRLWLFANDCGIGYFCFQLMHLHITFDGFLKRKVACIGRRNPVWLGVSSLCLYNTAKKSGLQDGKLDKVHKAFLCRTQKSTEGGRFRLTFPDACAMLIMLGSL